MFERKNIYVLNKKDKRAIVYEDAGDYIVRLTREVFASAEDFLRWKDWSDTEYHLAEKTRHLYSDNTLSLERLADATPAVESIEQQCIDLLNEREQKECSRLLMSALHACLTETQRRRLWLYCVEGMTVRQIASFGEVISDKSFERSTHFPQTWITVHPGATTARAICNSGYGLPLT